MAITVFTKVQSGVEATKGTPVAATNVMSWPLCYLKDDSAILLPEEARGKFYPRGRHALTAKGGSIEVPEHPMTFEELTYWLSCGVEYPTPTQDGTGGYVWQHDAPHDAAPAALKTLTLEGGNDQEAFEVEYCYPETFTIKGAVGEAWVISGTWRGRQVSSASFTAGQSGQTLEEVLFGKTSLFIDVAGGTIGTTGKDGSLQGLELTYPTGIKPVMGAHGELYFYAAAWRPVADQVPTGVIRVQYDTVGAALLAASKSGAIQLARLTTLGSAITGGTTYDNKTFNLDLALQLTEIPVPSDQEGSQILEIPFRVVDSDSTQCQFINVCNLDDLV